MKKTRENRNREATSVPSGAEGGRKRSGVEKEEQDCE